jgi:hypothetical protein
VRRRTYIPLGAGDPRRKLTVVMTQSSEFLYLGALNIYRRAVYAV